MNVLNKDECAHSSSESELESFANRLSVAMGSRSARSVAAACGMSDTVLRKYLNGESTPNVERLVAIAKSLDVTVEWLATGNAEEQETSPYAKQFWGEQHCDEFEFVNLYDAQVSMGSGAWNDSEHILSKLAFRKDWLKQESLMADRCAAIVAKGDSMEETIKDGATLLINLDDTSISRDGIYVIMFDGHLLAKRVQRTFDGGVIIRSDNPAYSDMSVPKDQMPQLSIVGRVVWYASVL